MTRLANLRGLGLRLGLTRGTHTSVSAVPAPTECGCAMSNSPAVSVGAQSLSLPIFNTLVSNATRVAHHQEEPYALYLPQFHRRQEANDSGPTDFTHRRVGRVRQRIAKFLSLFTVVQFANDVCRARRDGSDVALQGTCFHHLQCRSLGGSVSGECAQGYGVCCIFEGTCGETSRQNGTYFVSPEPLPADIPPDTGLTCQLTIEKVHPSVNQFRIDFHLFELAPPTKGQCMEEAFLVTGNEPGYPVPPICGFNNDQHIYVQLAPHDSAVTLTLRLRRPASRVRVKVTQLTQSDPLSAPAGCLQLHTGGTGAVASFNYAGPQPGYTNHLNYAVCIRKEPSHCSITYRTQGIFQLVNPEKDGMVGSAPGQAGAGVLFCPDDYVVLNGLRLCGDRFNDASVDPDNTHNAPVTDRSNGPFIMPVRTNGQQTGTGFSLAFLQNPCPGA